MMHTSSAPSSISAFGVTSATFPYRRVLPTITCSASPAQRTTSLPSAPADRTSTGNACCDGNSCTAASATAARPIFSLSAELARPMIAASTPSPAISRKCCRFVESDFSRFSRALAPC